MRFVYLDWDEKEAEFLPGVFVPLRPFRGVLGVARAEPGRYSTVPPGRPQFPEALGNLSSKNEV
jgi:acetamidase/formamidase